MGQSRSKTKRAIAGPFNVCGSAEDLQSLAHQILNSLPHSYGWVYVRPAASTQGHIPDTSPEPWDAP